MMHFDTLKIYSCGKHCEKRTNCMLYAISLFLTMFSSLHGTYFSFSMHFNPSPPKKTLVFICLQYNSFENPVGKGEIACNEQFLLFPTVFSTLSENFPPFSTNLKLLSANPFSFAECKVVVWDRVKMSSDICFNLDLSKILSSGKGLTLSQTSPGFYVSAV